MKRRLLLIAGAALLVPGMALAHGPTRQKTTLTTEVVRDHRGVIKVQLDSLTIAGSHNAWAHWREARRC